MSLTQVSSDWLGGFRSKSGGWATAAPAAFPSRQRRWLSERALDWAERLVVLTLYGWLVARMLHAYWTNGGITNLCLLPSEGLVVLFVLLRQKAVTISQRPCDWFLAFGATFSVLLVTPAPGKACVPPAISATVVMMGIVIQLHAKITLGRRFGLVPADRGIEITGPYRLVRHPIYAGYLLSHVGFLSANLLVWNVFMYAICYGLQVPRLLAEERLLSKDPAYRAYQATVRFRLIPGLF